MDDYNASTEPLCSLNCPAQALPRVRRPHPLSDQQAGRVHRQHRHPVPSRQPGHLIDVLADRVGPHHDFDAVVAE
jgi:hypothetical protein